MGFIGSMFSNNQGAGYQASGVNVDTSGILKPTGVAEAGAANGAVNNDLNQQQTFLNYLAQQNGIGNQSQVYNQLQGVANGTGPNPAQAMLANTTGQNVSQQAALMAGQRGAGANTGLIARQAAQQGATIQQNAAGQAAALQAQQSLGALNQLGGIAGQQVAQQQGGLSNLNQFAQGNQNSLANQIQGINNSAVGIQSNQNNNNAQIANTNTQGQQQLISGATGAAGSALGLAHGGQVPVSGPKSNVGKHLMAKGGTAKSGTTKGIVPGTASVKGDSYKNDKVKALLSPGEIVLPRSVTQSSDPTGEAAKFVAAIMASKGLK